VLIAETVVAPDNDVWPAGGRRPVGGVAASRESAVVDESRVTADNEVNLRTRAKENTMTESSDLPRVTVTVDGTELAVPGDLTILQALNHEGVHVPSLCNDIRLERSNGNCGLCIVELGPDARPVKACVTPVADGLVISTQSEPLASYRRLRLEQMLTDHNADCAPPCQQACPAHVDIQRYLADVADGNYEAAVRVIKDVNPFPSVCGRVCPHPCEAQCRRHLIDAPVSINHVKRFAADWELAQGRTGLPKVAAPTGRRVAIVGAGPSGLTAAAFLAQRGHAVTVFEKQPQAGGMLRYGIPEYRLPKLRLDAEIETIMGLGVRIVTDRSVGVHVHVESLRTEYDAVYMAFGSWQATPLAVDGDNLPGVLLGINFLERIAKGARLDIGDRVVVIGGGNTAVDCARAAVRRSASHVCLVYRRTLDEMPADRHEIQDAIAEGIQMVLLAAPDHISLSEDGHKELHCMRMELGDPDRSGRRRPHPVEGTEFTIPADTIIGAIGQSTNTQFLYNDVPLRQSRWGDLEVDGATMQTSEPGIFAGGDCVTGPATVIQAVAAGGRAARAIDEYIRTGQVTPAVETYNCSRGTLEDLPRDEFEHSPRLPRSLMPRLDMAHRVSSFDQVELGLTEAQAQAEAGRCLRCGCTVRLTCELRAEATNHGVHFHRPRHERPRLPVDSFHPFIVRDHNKCIACGKCLAACSEIEGVGVLAYQFAHGRLTVDTHNGLALGQTDCVSCGQCVTACPCGALDYRRERDQVFRAINDPSKVVVGFVAPAPRSVIAAQYGLAPDQASPFIAGLMRHLGFDKCFDMAFAADLTVMEETTEFLGRVTSGGVLPQFTSCCPGWVNLVERRYPGLIPHLSSCKSPQQMMGATIKNHFAQLYNVSLDDLFVVSIVPCLAKKYEAARPEMASRGVRDVDAVLTTTEFLEMVDRVRLDPSDVDPAQFDHPYGQVTGAGVIFGASGGVAEAALRMAVEKLTGSPPGDGLVFTPVPGRAGFREAVVEVPGHTVRVAVISGLGRARSLIEQVVAGEDTGYDLVEIMACPNGCVAGAGNPAPTRTFELGQRQQVLRNIDRGTKYRTSQDNPDLLRLYDDFYGEPCSPLAHELLHTSYRSLERVETR
jgi:formate dehydrogenase major subunit